VDPRRIQRRRNRPPSSIGPRYQVFQRHNDDVRRKVSAERLLIYEISEGWEPLCSSLGVPVPDAPMPHLNDTESFRAMFGMPPLAALVLERTDEARGCHCSDQATINQGRRCQRRRPTDSSPARLAPRVLARYPPRRATSRERAVGHHRDVVGAFEVRSGQ
jgi:hypothetical protein